MEQLTQQKELLEADDTRLRTLQEQLRATTSANGSDLQDKIKLLQSELDTERCEVAKRRTGSLDQDLSLVQEVVACTPDWQPLAQMMTSALESWGELINSWLNAAALLAQQSIGVQGQETARCEVSVRMSSIVLDAARAIEGLESVEALERLQGNEGLPDSETLLRVRVVGVTPRLFGVTDGKAVLYRGAHHG